MTKEEVNNVIEELIQFINTQLILDQYVHFFDDDQIEEYKHVLHFLNTATQIKGEAWERNFYNRFLGINIK